MLRPIGIKFRALAPALLDTMIPETSSARRAPQPALAAHLRLCVLSAQQTATERLLVPHAFAYLDTIATGTRLTATSAALLVPHVRVARPTASLAPPRPTELWSELSASVLQATTKPARLSAEFVPTPVLPARETPLHAPSVPKTATEWCLALHASAKPANMMLTKQHAKVTWAGCLVKIRIIIRIILYLP